MQGESRAGAVVVALTVSRKLLRAYDAIVPIKQRSRSIEVLMRKAVLSHQLSARVPDREIETMLEWLE